MTATYTPVDQQPQRRTRAMQDRIDRGVVDLLNCYGIGNSKRELIWKTREWLAENHTHPQYEETLKKCDTLSVATDAATFFINMALRMDKISWTNYRAVTFHPKLESGKSAVTVALNHEYVAAHIISIEEFFVPIIQQLLEIKPVVNNTNNNLAIELTADDSAVEVPDIGI